MEGTYLTGTVFTSKAWKYAVNMGSVTVASTVVLYRKGTAVGFLANGGVFTDLEAYWAIQRA